MQSQARTVSQAEYLRRLSDAERSNDALHVTRPDVVAALRFETPADAQIAALEQAVALHRKMAKASYQGSLRWKKRGLMDRRADQLRNAAESRRNRDRFAFTLSQLTAPRFAASVVAAE